MKSKTVRILLIDDERVNCDCFRAMVHEWDKEMSLGKGIHIVGTIQEDAVEDLGTLTLQDYDVIIVDQQFHNREQTGCDLLDYVNFETQYVIIISQLIDSLLPCYDDERVIAHLDRVVVLPKAPCMRTRHAKAGTGSASYGWWDSRLRLWLQEISQRL